ncbi:SYF2 (YGR129W) [Zygosaccharomyces parabailii]|uniref:Pre-mRNA-splicing factor SYF2 n=1 Tax=Zygosaccharomyces bailii (strain CLIB 213 / ATCC 58445 / CBS 680 / BCRC 21525 / NBRC 1098 / NCYC 1416 / NRRL Y-2227) TaxID=1333698 RepID=A0A8J2X6W8_ZYGB2|nr:SYF2 (YGR129W) [Zygosaccharomyces parabailii]CDF88772.1 ZYBA0S03-01596g1_1 [Zygosaccharomyces bailii CLIB 213]CDH15862.1 uncharacterized protein ZBAI_07649 [Zygosaccharomyces bailii ISA1307]SJM82743.1 uncharacterized protein ZBIST_0638 [Zygosaccharomyces bailii]
MDLENFIKDFNALKRRTLEISVENRKLVSEESKFMAPSQKPRVYRLNENEENRQDESKENPTVDEVELRRSKLMNYTIQQYQDWADKQHDKNTKKEGGDMSHLAKYTYEKELKYLKDSSMSKKQSNKVEKSPITGKLAVRDNSELLHRLARNMDKSAKERYNSRKKKMEKADVHGVKDAFINEKNKQFNEKLDRQLAREESD